MKANSLGHVGNRTFYMFYEEEIEEFEIWNDAQCDYKTYRSDLLGILRQIPECFVQKVLWKKQRA